MRVLLILRGRLYNMGGCNPFIHLADVVQSVFSFNGRSVFPTWRQTMALRDILGSKAAQSALPGE
jgi:hypothetical protein